MKWREVMFSVMFISLSVNLVPYDHYLDLFKLFRETPPPPPPYTPPPLTIQGSLPKTCANLFTWTSPTSPYRDPSTLKASKRTAAIRLKYLLVLVVSGTQRIYIVFCQQHVKQECIPVGCVPSACV